MPYKFEYIPDDEDEDAFTCLLQCERCTATTKTGRRCARNTCIGIKYCWMHLLSMKKLRIKESTIPNSGKGLFAIDKTKGPRAIIFKGPRRGTDNGETIIEYDGEIINDDELVRRYGEYTGPYATRGGPDINEDGACKRGVGNLANHKTGAQANAKFKHKLNGRGGTFDHFELVATKPIRNDDEIFINYFGRGRRGEYRFDEPITYKTKPVSRRRGRR